MLQSVVYVSDNGKYKAEIQYGGRTQWHVWLYEWRRTSAARHGGWIKTGENLERTLTKAQAVARGWTK